MAELQNEKTAPPAKKRKSEDAVNGLNVDHVLDSLLHVRKRPPINQSVTIPEEVVKDLCHVALTIFHQQPMLLELDSPLNLCGDVHGQYHDLLRIFDTSGYPPQANYLFLGDYVDRGKRSLETICLLFAYKVKFPENFFLLRGNHESPSICRIYGFYDECKSRYSIKIWKTFCDVFNYMPACALIADKVICMHGGLSFDMIDAKVDLRSKINSMQRPADIPDSGFLCDLLWSDPSEATQGFGVNDRGVSVSFGPEIVQQFLKLHDFDLIVRAHQVVEDGYEFFSNRGLVTLFFCTKLLRRV